MEATAAAQPVELVVMTTPTGHPVWVPRGTVEAIRNQGGDTLEIVIPGDRDQWLTVSEAARQHQEDVDDLAFEAARKRIIHAAQRGELKASGTGRDRRIDPTSLNAWRLAKREEELDRIE